MPEGLDKRGFGAEPKASALGSASELLFELGAARCMMSLPWREPSWSPLPLLARLSVAFALHCASLWYVGFVGHSDSRGIADVGFSILPRLPAGYGDVLPCAFLILVLASLGSALEEYLTLGSWLMILRSFCVAATVLPPSDPACRPDSLAILHGGCRDKVFSGHVAYMTLSAFYLRRRLGPVVWALTVAEAGYLVAAREHYTVDVLVAACFSVLVVRAYARRVP